MMEYRIIKIIFILLAGFYTAAATASPVNEETITSSSREWLSYGRDYQEHRFSPLDSINLDTVGDLGLAWSIEFPTSRGMEATPLIHNGVIYISTAWSHVYAIDARSGKQLWHFDAGVDKAHLIRTCCGPNNRGVALWQNDADSSLQVFFGALDGRLIALDAISGTQNWSVQTTPTDGNYSITGAPRVVNGMVVIGNGGADLGVRGFVSAYDAQSGEQQWRFYTVPGDRNKPQESQALERALDTWKGDYWYKNGGGGGTAWDSLVYDPNLNLLYIGTGNGSPWNREIRSPGGGDNLYLSSIVALNADTGEYVWHYQTTPKENWDYTATQHLVLAELTLDGRLRSVIMQAPKNGFFYVLDRLTGELLSADAYAYVTWASHIDMATGRPVETKLAEYQSTKGSVIWPAPFGAHNWQPMSFSSKTGLMYIPAQHAPGIYTALEKANYGVGRWNIGVDMNEIKDLSNWVGAIAVRDALVRGELIAWDPVKRKPVWKVRHAHPANGGVLSTAGDLVFQGTREGIFYAYNASNGDLVWQHQTDSAILAGPISYELDGEQYIAVAQGGGGAVMMTIGEHLQTKNQNHNRLLVFKLNAAKFDDKVQAEKVLVDVPVLPHDFEDDIEQVALGSMLYGRNCSVCHGISANSNGVVPDLRYMSAKTHAEFTAIAFGGSRAHLGMVGFYKALSIEEVTAIHAYLDKQQLSLQGQMDMSFFQKIEYWVFYGIAKLGERFPVIINISRDYLK